MDLLFILFIVCVGGCWLISKIIGGLLFPDKKEDNFTFIDKSVHYHEHKSISIIDDTTKRKIFELRESKEK